jgi:hypothetical protein
MNKHRPHSARGLLTGPARAAAAGHVKDDRDVSGAFFLAGRQILHKQALQDHRGPALTARDRLWRVHTLSRRFIFQNQTFAKAATRRHRATADIRVPAVFPG